MTNYIVIAVIMLVVFILVFYAFVADDSENDAGYLADDSDNTKTEKVESEKEETQNNIQEITENGNVIEEASVVETQSNIVAFDDSNSIFQQLSDEEEKKQTIKPAEITRIHTINKPVESNI